MRARHSVWILAAGVLAGGCAPTTSSSSPEFTGPWAANYHAAYDAAQSRGDTDVVTMLADGELSDLEFRAVTDAFVACAATEGVTVTVGERLDVAYSSDATTDTQEAAVDQCAVDTGWDGLSFWREARVNPLKEDLIPLVSRCQVRLGLIDREYSDAEFEAYSAAINALTAEDQEEATRCLVDPTAGGEDREH